MFEISPFLGELLWMAQAIVPAYLIGSVPFGLLLVRAARLGNVRDIGSGNIGATNVLRTGERRLAAATLLLDIGKGTLAVLAAKRLGPEYAAWAALAVVAGHMFPPWLWFRGGKGVATSFGAIAVLSWPVALVASATWLAMAGAFRISSPAALSALVLAAPIALWGLLSLQRAGTLPLDLPGDPAHLPMLVVIAVLIIVRHQANVRRFIRGEEPRIGEDTRNG